jgi:hypothetical protein
LTKTATYNSEADSEFIWSKKIASAMNFKDFVGKKWKIYKLWKKNRGKIKEETIWNRHREREMNEYCDSLC